MLVGIGNSGRVEADLAIKGNKYRCPRCNGPLILKQGRKVIHHFAHHPGNQCCFATGETRAHLNAKNTLCSAFRARGLKAELEYFVGDDRERRADVLVWHPDGDRIAVELQHCSISLDEIERRAFSYAAMDITQLWIPFIDRARIESATEPDNSTITIKRYSPPLYVRWIDGLTKARDVWFYEPEAMALWRGSLSEYRLWVDETSYHDEYGDEHIHGGYKRVSKRWKTLTLNGPFRPDELKLKRFSRPKKSRNKYNWPKSRLATFVVSDDKQSSDRFSS